MVTSTSSSSSCSSINSFDDLSFTAAGKPVKFLCSHGGKILPRYPDGKLRYVGGETRVLAVPRSIPFSDLQAQMMKLCGSESPVILRCQLPTEELDDALVSITSDEDLSNLFEEYDLAGRDRLKIRVFLFPQLSNSHASSSSPPPPVKREYTARPPLPVVARRCVHQITRQHQTMRNRLR